MTSIQAAPIVSKVLGEDAYCSQRQGVPADLTLTGRAAFLSQDSDLVLCSPSGAWDLRLPSSQNLAGTPVRALSIAPGGAYVAVATTERVLVFDLADLQGSLKGGSCQAKLACTLSKPNVKAAYWEPHGRPLLLCLSGSEVSLCMAPPLQWLLLPAFSQYRRQPPFIFIISIYYISTAACCIRNPYNQAVESGA